MASTYLRPLTSSKRVKLVLTCDNCKDRKVKCDKERPECGTCKKTRRPCSYNYADRTVLMRDQQGLGSLPDSTCIQNQLNYLQGMQFGQLFEEAGFLAMATRGVDVDNLQIPGMLARPLVTAQPGDNIFDNIQVPQPSEDSAMNELTSSISNLRLYESTRYIGEGSLLMLDDDNNELIIPEQQEDFDWSVVDDSLKYLPNLETEVEQLINLYYKHVHRYFPALRIQVIWDALQQLSKPQHLLLLNCIFCVASPFHDDPDKQDGKIFFDRAEELLYEYCTKPHVLTVISIVILSRHNKQAGTAWTYHGIATKMLLELGLHRKCRNLIFKMDEVERLRNEAFWMTFISENFVSTTYGRPNMIDETDCNIEVPRIPYDQLDENVQLEIAYINLINLSRICARVRKYLHAAPRLRILMQDDQNKFRVLDVALSCWLHELPQWLKFDEIMKDPDGTLLNGIGGDMHIFFSTIMILLHGRYLKPANQYADLSYSADSPVICMQHAIIIVHYLEILLTKHPEFFALAVSGPFAISPAKRVFTWHAKFDSENRKKSEEMKARLEAIEGQILKISRTYDRGRIHNENFNDRPTEWLASHFILKRVDRTYQLCNM
ncbi:fungal-specific transcription factor domain-containing protein [Gigaspora rosea]|uniref:Fungal-specific transcription factor domain-containing protein n=1 Tax=Gigaspora rosea TaxID=44941 RepID=A0A397U2E6_9GLOM|nr:fungal-specific transcription factor domain-containing protein [Gigaspora rosea]